MRLLPIAIVTIIAFTLSNAVYAGEPEIVPRHVNNWAYYGFVGEGDSLEANWMAEHATYVEAAPSFAQRFKAAGGHYAVAYTDPFRVIPTHHEPLSGLPEHAWLHDAAGRRIAYNYPGWGVQNQLNPTDPEMVAGYKALTESIRRSAPYDFVEMDDASFDLENAFWHFSSRAIEIHSEREYDDAITNLLRSATLPVFVSGFSNEDHHADDYSGNVTFLSAAAGAINNEGCFTSTAPKSEKQWSFDHNTLLAITRAHKPAVCWGQNAATNDIRIPRLFFYASWLLTYDPDYSIAFENFTGTGHVSIFPEENIVPRDPVQTAQSTIRELKSPRGYYSREFRHCFQWGKAIGRCAVVVNASNYSVPITTAAHDYAFQLSIDILNSANGGKAVWIRGHGPDRLGPYTGLILRATSGS